MLNVACQLGCLPEAFGLVRLVKYLHEDLDEVGCLFETQACVETKIFVINMNG